MGCQALQYPGDDLAGVSEQKLGKGRLGVTSSGLRVFGTSGSREFGVVKCESATGVLYKNLGKNGYRLQPGIVPLVI